MSNFYNTFLTGYRQEKTASEKAANSLERFDADELEKMAEEISLSFANPNNSMLKIAEEEEEEKEDKEKEADSCEENKEDKEEKEAESEDEKEEEKESEDEEEDKEAESEDEDEEEKESEDEEDEEKESEDEEDEKEAFYSDEELEKMAFEFSEEKLAEHGLGVIDYVYEKVADEEVAGFITENAEKLAYLTNQPILKVADDIVNSILEKLS